MSDFRFDWQRAARAGVPEVVLAQNKSVLQLLEIAQQGIARQHPIFMTRVSEHKAQALQDRFSSMVHFHAESQSVYLSEKSLEQAMLSDASQSTRIAIVAAGTSDVPVVAEVEQSLLYMGIPSRRYVDVGVAGLWRLTELVGELSGYSLIIAVAGMEGALFSVLAGLIPCPVIAVPVSVGYGVGEGGHVALNSALSSCVPGIAVVNIDNGFGAAALAAKLLAMSGTGDKTLQQ